MTTNAVPSRPARAVAPVVAGRMLWIEIKRNAVPWALPLLAALFFYDTYRTTSGYPPIWTIRATVVPGRLVFDFAAFAAGLSAWMGSREGRRKTGELLAPTARHAVTRRLAALSATLLWVLLAFGAGVAVLYIQTAGVVTWGGPPLWPVAVGAVAMITLCVLGFTCGVLFPGRFTAPLVAIAGGLLPLVGSHDPVQLDPSNVHDLLALSVNLAPYDIGVFYHVPPDVSIAQVMFMGGIAVAALGVLALSPALHVPRGGSWAGARTGWWLRAVPAVVVVAGVAASWTAYDLVGTARPTATGWSIPALHDAASDRPVPYAPDCAGTAFKVCLHPAFSAYLGGVAGALGPVAAELAGLPGVPVRAEQMASPLAAPFLYAGIAGTPRVYEFIVGIDWRSTAVTSSSGWRAEVQEDYLATVIGGSGWKAGNLGPAQQAVVNALMAAVGSPSQTAFNGLPLTPQVAAAARRFAALPATSRRAWLAAHLQALESGRLAVGQIP